MSRVLDKREKFASKLRFARGAAPGYSQIASVVRGMGIRGETKSVDVQEKLSVFQTNTGAVGNLLNGTQEGAGFWNRIGRKIAMKSLTIRGQIISNAGVPVSYQPETLRYIIYYDKQPNGLAATWDQIVKSYTDAGAVASNTLDGLNLDNRDRFVVLRDRHIAMPGTGPIGQPATAPYGTSIGTLGGGSDGAAIVKEYIKLKNLETQYNGTSNPATVATIATGSLSIIFQGDVGGQWTLEYASRLRFTDA